MKLGEKLKQLRKERGLSQDELAEVIDIDGRQISKYEHNKIIPSVEVALKLAKAFNVSLDYLIIEDVPRTSIKYTNNSELIEILQSVDSLPEEDMKALKNIINAIVTKEKFKKLATTSK